VIGLVAAGTLEYEVLRELGSVSLLFVGFVEEAMKLLFLLLFFFAGRYRSEAAGIVLGVSTGMGFAAFETMGYGFVTVLQSRENLIRLDEVLLVRGLASPAAHAAWTGLVAAALWQERLRAGRPVINARVVGAFLLAAALHALWDTFLSLRAQTPLEALGSDSAGGLIAFASFALLIIQIRRAERSPGTSNPDRSCESHHRP
jgi:RsiW-degrading membrane proteinase PrsW (M82 family)